MKLSILDQFQDALINGTESVTGGGKTKPKMKCKSGGSGSSKSKKSGSKKSGSKKSGSKKSGSKKSGSNGGGGCPPISKY